MGCSIALFIIALVPTLLLSVVLLATAYAVCAKAYNSVQWRLAETKCDLWEGVPAWSPSDHIARWCVMRRASWV